MKKLQLFDQNHGLSPLQKCQFCLLFKSMFILSRKACFLTKTSPNTFSGCICIGNSMIVSDIWHKYHEWYFEIGIRKGEWNLRQFWNITIGIDAKYHVQIMLLFVYTTTIKRFVIFTFRYFKLSWNTTALSQSNCRNFSCSTIMHKTKG